MTISVGATIVDMAAVALTAQTLGTVGGAIGRALLAATTVLLALQYLKHKIDTPISEGIPKSLLLSAGAAIPLALVDQFLTRLVPVHPILRLPSLLVCFLVLFTILSRRLRIFKTDDFKLLEKALPRTMHSRLRLVQRPSQS